VSAFRVAVDIGHLIPGNAPVNRDTFPHLAYAVGRIAEHGLSLWKAYAGGTPLPDGKVVHARSGRYMRNTQMHAQGDFSRELFNDTAHADVIERGAPAYDMKRMLDSSMKVRISKKGKRYLIIPFRWGVPTAQVGDDGKTPTGLRMMPESVHSAWQGMRTSRVKGQGWRMSGTGAYDTRTRQPYLVGARQYRWGSRMSKDTLAELGVHGRDRRHMAGMVHFQNPAGRGGGKHGQYLTFRIMSEDAKGWMARARPGYWPARHVANQLRPLAQRAFEKATEADVARFLGLS